MLNFQTFSTCLLDHTNYKVNLMLCIQDIIEMRNELARKEELLKKHGDKLNEWQGLLSSMQSRLGTSPSIGPRPPGPSGPTMHPGMMGAPSGSHNSVPMPGLSPVGSSMGPSTMGSSTMGPSGPSMPHNMNPGMGMPQSSMMQASIKSNVGNSNSVL